jgi:hypothetical protein
MRGVNAALADSITISANDAVTFAGAPPMVEATPGAPEVRAPETNDALNTDVCKRDMRGAIGKAHYRTGTQASNLHITALSQCMRQRQAYMAHSHYTISYTGVVYVPISRRGAAKQRSCRHRSKTCCLWNLSAFADVFCNSVATAHVHVAYHCSLNPEQTSCDRKTVVHACRSFVLAESFAK